MKKHTISSPLMLGQALRLERQEQHLTQEKVGTRVGIDQSTISGIENGNPGTRLDTLFHFLAALDLELVIQPRNAPKSNTKERW